MELEGGVNDICVGVRVEEGDLWMGKGWGEGGLYMFEG